MGRKKSWFSSVKKALSPDSKEKKAEKVDHSKKKWFGKEKMSIPDSADPVPVEVSHYPIIPLEEVKLMEVENEQTGDAYSIAVATVAAAEATAAAAQAAAVASRLTMVTQFTGKSKEEVAAVRIQTAFRGYLVCSYKNMPISYSITELEDVDEIVIRMWEEGVSTNAARRALRALRGLVRLKSLVDGPIVKRQTLNTLKCMQTLSRVQSQVQSRRILMMEENRALQRQLLQKPAKELESLRMGDEWDDSLQSKEQIEVNLLHKYEAAMRRERALAYSYTHQQTWKKSAKPTNLLFMDPTNPHWGWSWLERWMASQPSETTKAATEKDLNSDRLSAKTTSLGEITKSFTRHQLNSENSPSSPASLKPTSSHPSPATPSSKILSSVTGRKLNASPKVGFVNQDDDSTSTFSVQSGRNRRHTIAGSSVRNDNLAISPSAPSYMAPTHSAKAKLKLPSPLGMENGYLPEKASATSVKKRLSYPPSPGRPRRLSTPQRKIDPVSFVETDVPGVVN